MIGVILANRMNLIPRIGMFGTAHWFGTFDGDPALVLSFYGGTRLWVFNSNRWCSPVRKECLRDMDKYLGLVYGKPYPKNIVMH